MGVEVFQDVLISFSFNFYAGIHTPYNSNLGFDLWGGVTSSVGSVTST